MSNLGGQGLVMTFLLVAGRFAYQALGPEGFGVVLFGLTLSAALSAAFDLGIAATAVREVSARRRSEPQYVVRLSQTATLQGLAGFLMLAALAWAAMPFLVKNWLRLEGDTAGAVLSLRVLALGGLTALPRGVASALLRGAERMDVTNAIDVVCIALQQAGLVAAARADVGLLGIAAWLAASQVGWYVAYLPAVAKVLGRDALKPRWNADAARRTARFTLNAGVVSLLAMVHTQADRLVVSRLLPIAAFGWYAFGFAAIARASVVTGAVAQAALPSLAAFDAAGDRSALRARYERLQALVCFGAAPLFAAVPFAVRPVYEFVFDAATAGLLLAPLTLVAIGFYLNGTLMLPYMASLAVGRPDIALRSNLWALIAVLPATVVLVRTFGLTGAGLSWVGYQLFAYGYTARRIRAECLGIPWADFLQPTVRAAGTALSLYGLAWAGAWAAGSGPGALAIGWSLATVAYSMVAVRFVGSDLGAAVRMLRGRPA